MKANGRAIAILLGWGGAVVAAASGAETEPPRLAVVISIDQCRADYLERFRPYFVEGGFRRLIEHGAYFRDAHHRHAMTATAPGHATIVTGVSARDHGIVANEWFDPAAGRVMGAVEDPTAPLVPEAPERTSMPGMPDAERSGSPRRLLAATIGDQLKLRHGATSRAISIANKDRAAVFLGGRSADAAYWIVNGRVVTSRFYRDALPEWLVRFNAEDRVVRAFGHTWDRLLERDVYDAVQGPDDTAGEESRHGLGTTFPRKVDGGRAVPDQEYFNAYRLAPHGSVVLEELARATIEHEQLGQREGATDLLCIGFSQTDYAGHSFGPDSHEIMDSVLRLDRALVSLLATLDREVGEGRYVVVLTADHGVAPLPERLPAQERGRAAGRLDRPELHRLAEAALSDAFGPPPDGTAWSVLDGYGFRLVPRALAARGVDAPNAQRVLKTALLRSPQIALAWTRDELLGAAASGESLDAWRLSFHAERSGDVVFSPKPYVVDRSPAGTNHGTPYPYDTHVPLVWFGAGVPKGVRNNRVGTDQIAPTLAALLQIPPPPLARGEPLFRGDSVGSAEKLGTSRPR